MARRTLKRIGLADVEYIAFQYGNKRIAVTTLLFFLVQNGKWLSISNDQIYEFARNVAESKSQDREHVMLSINSFIKNNIENYNLNK